MVRPAISKRAALSVQQLAQPTRRQFSTPVDDRLSSIAGTSPLQRAVNPLHNAVNATTPRYDWTKDEIRQIYNTPLMELAHQAVRRAESIGHWSKANKLW